MKTKKTDFTKESDKRLAEVTKYCVYACDQIVANQLLGCKSHKDVADKIDVHQNFIYYCAAGTRFFRIEYASLLVTVFDVSAIYLMTGKGEVFGNKTTADELDVMKKQIAELTERVDREYPETQSVEKIEGRKSGKTPTKTGVKKKTAKR